MSASIIAASENDFEELIVASRRRSAFAPPTSLPRSTPFSGSRPEIHASSLSRSSTSRRMMPSSTMCRRTASSAYPAATIAPDWEASQVPARA
ncbi:hypothetical protein [Streptomyces sp. L7]|uniref:hypothetical protein n=1 Tax=Streptomyces sp. L7 TaxID=3423954 RepID=UPI003D96C9B8